MEILKSEATCLREINASAARIAENLGLIAKEIAALTAVYQSATLHEINEIMLANLKAQMGGGIVAAGGILKPGH